MMKKEENNDKKERKGIIGWIKKLGVIGFLFFTLKGLVWLAIFFGIGKLFSYA